MTEIYIMNPMGAVLSPDGQTVAFHQVQRDQCCAIKLMDSDGGDERYLGDGRWPSWSPDGKRIAFNHAGVEGAGDIWVIDVTGSG